MSNKPINSTRRYKVGQVTQYDHFYTQFHSLNPVLSETGRQTVGGDFYKDADNLRKWQNEIEGSPDGTILKNKNRVLASLPQARKNLKAAMDEFEKERQTAINSGKIPPQDPSRELAEKIYKAEARVDVERLALARVKERLAAIREKNPDKFNPDVLPYGPVESAKMNADNILREIDGQTVSLIKKNLVIDDPRSPYDGMSVPEYRKMAKAWRRARSKKRDELRERQKKGEDVHIPFGVSRVDAKDLPAWPDGVPNMKNKKK